MKTLLEQQIIALIDSKDSSLTNLANILACLYQELKNVNWVGIYLCNEKKQECILGPFQGKPACTHIPYKKGVVGTCAYEKKSILVKNVHQFKGHIACDSASNSEVVYPLIFNNELLAILDIDSPNLNNFSQNDYLAIERISRILSELLYNDKQWIHSAIHSRDVI